MKVRYHPDARAELLDAVEWYEERCPMLGADFLTEVRRAETMIAQRPATWQRWPGVAADVRRFKLARFPYCVAFQETGEDIVVIAVAVFKAPSDSMSTGARKKAEAEQSKWDERQKALQKWLGKTNSWQSFVDFWAVDWDYYSRQQPDGKTIFETDWQSFRVRKSKGENDPSVFTAEFKYAQPGQYWIAAMFRTAVADELIQFTPCVVARGILPKKVDKDPAWRAQAIYTRQEVESLISDSRIPQDRRVLYALDAVAGLRHGEAAGLRWSQYDEKAVPLLAKTKTGVPRSVPVHPTLARILAEWKLAGWERTYGRMPTPDDFITPTRNMTARTAQESPKQLHEDQNLLGMRRRRGHDLRRTFITLARVDGARLDLLQTITHGPRGDIMNMYTTFPWPTLCAEVAKLKIDVLEGKVLDGDFGTLATSLATSQLRGRNRWRKVVTPSGLEPEITP